MLSDERGSIKLTIDIMTEPRIKLLNRMENGARIILLWLKLIVRSSEKTKGGAFVFKVCGLPITNGMLKNIFDEDEQFIDNALSVMEEYGLLKREVERIVIDPFWEDERDRNSPEYRAWRRAVFDRDGYVCQICGGRENLQAHHIVYWRDTVDNKDLRFDVDNGVTLCRDCHLAAHHGGWRK